MDLCESDLPFKVGQQVESRSFQEGFRGAWFRSKINTISRRRNGQLGYDLKFLDFPDEKKTWTKICQKPPAYNRKLEQQRQVLMVRPCFPAIYRESQMPDVNTITEVIVIVNDAWKVGDLIDWWKDDCYWSGSITNILEDEKFQIALFPPPLGEGLSYEVCCKDLRPSLDWSPKRGWTVPTPMDSNNRRCARLLKPVKQGTSRSSIARTAGEERTGVQGTAGASQLSFTSHVSSSSAQPHGKLEGADRQSLGSDARKETIEVSDMENASSSDSDSSSHVKAKLTGMNDEASVGKERSSGGEERQCAGVVDGAPDSPFTSHATSGSLSQPRVEFEDVEEQPLGATAGTKRHRPETNVDVHMKNGGAGKTSCSDSDSSLRFKAGTSGMGDETGVVKETLDHSTERDIQDRVDCGRPSKKKSRVDRKMPLNSRFSDTIEAAVVDLEELLNLVKWMKGMLNNENTTRPRWKFLAHRASSMPR